MICATLLPQSSYNSGGSQWQTIRKTSVKIPFVPARPSLAVSIAVRRVKVQATQSNSIAIAVTKNVAVISNSAVQGKLT